MTQNQDVNRLIIAAGAMKTVGVSIDVDGNEAIITGNGSGGGAGGSSSEQGLHLTFDLIANCPVQPPTDVAAWNTYLSTDAITTATVNGNSVVLLANHTFRLRSVFNNNTAIKHFIDASGYVTSCDYKVFNSCDILETLVFTGDTTFYEESISNNPLLTYLSINNTKIHTGYGGFGNSVLKKLDANNLVTVGDNFLESGYVSDLIFPELVSCGSTCFSSLDLTSAYYEYKVVAPKLKTIGNACFYSTSGQSATVIYLSALETAGSLFLSNVLTDNSIVHLESLKKVGQGSFGGNTGKVVTVYTNKHFAQTSAEYKAFKALNTVTEILIDNDVIEQVTTSADLTTTATTGAALDCNGATQAQLTLTLGTATTAPALQVQGSDDGTNWYNLGVPLTGVASSTVTIQLDNILPKNLRWKVSTAGASIGVGYKIILKAL